MASFQQQPLVAGLMNHTDGTELFIFHASFLQLPLESGFSNGIHEMEPEIFAA